MNIKVATLNCFDSPIAKDRRSRLKKIAQELVAREPDIICLQEIIFPWSARMMSKIFERAGYCVVNNIGLVANKGGLLFASRFPVVKKEFTYFSSQGKIFSQQITDRILGKGYQKIIVNTGSNIITFFNSHIIAIYRNESLGEQRARDYQITELAHVIGSAPDKVVLAGDMNMKPGENIYNTFITMTNLHDPLAQDGSITFSSKNTHATNVFGNDFDSRLDYIMHSNNIRSVETKIIFDNTVNIEEKAQHLSDHFGVEAVITLDHTI